MRAHEVPTHIGAEDKVLLWFTFPRIVAMIATCALAYGAYRMAPIGPSEVRLGIAVALGLLGLAAIVGKIGGRSLPLVTADLLRYALGPRRYAGTTAELVRNEPPAPVETKPGPLSLMVKKAGRGLRKLRRLNRSKERRNGRRPFRPHGWFGKRRAVKGENDKENRTQQQEAGRKPKRRKAKRTLLSLVAVAMLVVAIPQVALADGHWGFDFEPPEPVLGRRLFVERLEVSAEGANVTLRAATALDLRVRAYGGWQGSQLRFYRAASLNQGETVTYDLPLSGEAPSFTFSWEDTLGQAGALTLKDEQLPYPLPSVAGELCDLRVASLGWSPGRIEGVIASDCVSTTLETISLQTVAGHDSVTELAVMDAAVTAITGTVSVAVRGSRATASFVPNGETSFSMSIGDGEAIHSVAINADLRAGLEVALPPLVQLTHHPERTEQIIRTVSMVRPGASDGVSETVTLTCEDGTTEEHVISAYVSIPSEVIYKNVTISILHPEHVKAEVVERAPITKSRRETANLAPSIASDDPYETLTLPEPEEEDEAADQSSADDEARDLFDRLGWWWPW